GASAMKLFAGKWWLCCFPRLGRICNKHPPPRLRLGRICNKQPLPRTIIPDEFDFTADSNVELAALRPRPLFSRFAAHHNFLRYGLRTVASGARAFSCEASMRTRCAARADFRKSRPDFDANLTGGPAAGACGRVALCVASGSLLAR